MKTPTFNIFIEAHLPDHLKYEPEKNFLHYAIIASCQRIYPSPQSCLEIVLVFLRLIFQFFFVISKTESHGSERLQ